MTIDPLLLLLAGVWFAAGVGVGRTSMRRGLVKQTRWNVARTIEELRITALAYHIGEHADVDMPFKDCPDAFCVDARGVIAAGERAEAAKP